MATMVAITEAVATEASITAAGLATIEVAFMVHDNITMATTPIMAAIAVILVVVEFLSQLVSKQSAISRPG